MDEKVILFVCIIINLLTIFVSLLSSYHRQINGFQYVNDYDNAELYTFEVKVEKIEMPNMRSWRDLVIWTQRPSLADELSAMAISESGLSYPRNLQELKSPSSSSSSSSSSFNSPSAATKPSSAIIFSPGKFFFFFFSIIRLILTREHVFLARY